VPALIFDLDGTLVDTVYAHVFAWQQALAEAEMPIDGWRIHRRIGMSGGLFARAVGRELGRALSPEEVEAVQARHGELFRGALPERRPLPGAVELLDELRATAVPHGIATWGGGPRSMRRSRRSALGQRRSSSKEAAFNVQSQSLTCSSSAPSSCAFPRRSATSSGTRSGIFSLPDERAC
jgi:beta-phosphoglucomutase-like phosphatase (HAD superfamily)